MTTTTLTPFMGRLLGLGSYAKTPPRPAKTKGKPVAAPESNGVAKEDTVAAAPAELRPDMVVELVRQGLPARSFGVLCDAFQLPQDRLARVIHLAPRTLARRKIFKPAESERILRLGRLFQQATEVLGDEGEARDWLLAPAFGLGGAVPLDYAGTEVGAREVEHLLGRIDHGIFA